MATARRLDGYSLDDWEALDPVDGHRVELVNGRFVVNAAPSVPNQRVADRLESLLDSVAAEHGMEATAAIGVRVAPGVGYIPDVVVCTDLVDPDLVLGLVDTTTVEVELVVLVVEVVSPSTAHRDRLEKLAAFAAAGVPAYWRVEIGHDEGPVVHCYRLCYRLDQGTYVETTTLEAGTTGTVDVAGSMTVSFDPADLLNSASSCPARQSSPGRNWRSTSVWARRLFRRLLTR